MGMGVAQHKRSRSPVIVGIVAVALGAALIGVTASSFLTNKLATQSSPTTSNTLAVSRGAPRAARSDTAPSDSTRSKVASGKTSSTLTTLSTVPPATLPAHSTAVVAKKLSSVTMPPLVTTTTLGAASTTIPAASRSTSTTTTAETRSGDLAPPFTTRQVAFHTAAGPVQADVSWSGGAAITVTLHCGDATAAKTASTSAYLSVHSQAGRCDVVLNEVEATNILQTYTMFVSYNVAK